MHPEFALLDTNILLYRADQGSPFYLSSKELLDKGFAGEVNLCVCPQVLMEFFRVITDPKRVERPRVPKEAIEEIRKILFSLNIAEIYPGEDTLIKTLDLLGKYNLTARKVFDCQIVATMLSNGINRIYTFNQKDFTMFEEIEVLIPT